MDQEQVKKGFNSGYYLAKNHPTLFEKLREAIQDKEQDYAKGFLSGSLEYSKENTIEHRNPSKSIDTDQARSDEWKRKMKSFLNRDKDIKRER